MPKVCGAGCLCHFIARWMLNWVRGGKGLPRATRSSEVQSEGLVGGV